MKHLLGSALLIVLVSPVAAAEPAPEQLDFFETRIRPVLSQHCYACHSSQAAQEGKLRGGLRLDTRDEARKGGDSGPAVVPGKPDESLLVSALRHEDFEMPPKGKLPDRIIADFVKWIETGAVDPREGEKAVTTAAGIDIEAGKQFWSFQPLAKVAPPQADAGGWARTPIDQFIRAKQNELGVHPNPVAEPRILIRRAWFDLLGLPPTPEEIRYWTGRLIPLAGTNASRQAAIDSHAWSELIDQLLASPHYGERWARHWMDVARFAESHGYEQDYDRPNAYHYRDFLIRAFNDDLPYDDFIRWQLAGDEFAPDNPLAWMATGFLGGGAFPTQLTEAEFESARYDELDDMVATTGVAFLGLSVGCARCHDHKFDPIPSRDYYELAACFTTAIRSEKEFDLEPEENKRRLKTYEARLAELRRDLRQFEEQELPRQFEQWLAKYEPGADEVDPWEVLDGELTSSTGAKYVLQSDRSWLATGPIPDSDELTFTAETTSGGLVAFRLEALTHDSLPQKGPGLASNGNFALGNFVVTAQPKDRSSEPRSVKLIAARATHQQNEGSLAVAASIDADPISGWAVDGQIGRDHAAMFVAESPIEHASGMRLSIRMTFRHPNRKHAIGRLRLSVSPDSTAQPQVGRSGLDAKVAAALQLLKDKGIAADATAYEAVFGWFKKKSPDWQKQQQALCDHERTGPQRKITKVMVTSEGLPHLPHHADGRGFPHFYSETHFLRRGDVHQKGEIVTAGFLEVLKRNGRDDASWRISPPENSRTSFRRATLANWITDVEHGAGHLAARVMVNRLWQHHFGRGIVATPNDFGASGERPSHPELLDWLAHDLIKGGWRLKRLHKQIMTSSVYLQSSDFDEDRAQRDRDAVSLWRRVPRRLEAEAVRDSMLAVSGQLDRTMFGPGTLDPNMRRRSIYFFIKRSQLIPMMMLFDWPEHLVSIGQRASTTIAPQALMFLNSPQGRRAAEGFAERLKTHSAPAMTEQAYWIAFGRGPSEKEKRLAMGFLERQTARHQAAGHPAPAQLARVDLCQMLLSANEFIYVD